MKKGFAVAIVLLSVLMVQLGISGLAAERLETISGIYQPVEAEKAEMSTGVYQPVDMERAEMSHAVYQPVETEKVEESTATYPVYEIARDEYDEMRTSVYPIHRIAEGEYAEMKPPVAASSEGTIFVITNLIKGATFTISGPATYSGGGLTWGPSNVLSGTYTITYGSFSRYSTPPSETKTLSAGGSITFKGDYLIKIRSGDSFDFGHGYILLIRKVDPDGGEVSIELQWDNHIIDEKILRKGGSYLLKKDTGESLSIKVVDMYHDTTGNYVVLLPKWYLMVEPHLNLIVSSDPPGADIFIDGRYAGKTRRKIPFALDTIDFSKMYSLRLVLSGHEDAEQNFQFEPGKEEKEVPITLNRIQQTPTPPTPTPMLVPHTHSPTPPPEPTPVPHTYSPSPSIPTSPPAETPVPHTHSPTPPTVPTLVPHTYSPSPSIPTPPPAETLVPHTYSPTPSTPEPTPEMAIPPTYSPSPTPPGFLAISYILAILCVYWILKRKHS